MKLSAKHQPLVILSWPEYKRKSVLDRFPLAILCGILILVLSIGILYDKAMNLTAENVPVSHGLSVIAETGEG